MTSSYEKRGLRYFTERSSETHRSSSHEKSPVACMHVAPSQSHLYHLRKPCGGGRVSRQAIAIVYAGFKSCPILWLLR